MVEFHRKPPKGQSAQTQAEVAEGDIEEISEEQEIDNNPQEPGRHDRRSEFGFKGHQTTGYDFYRPDDAHEVSGSARNFGERWPQVHGPIHQIVKEFVETREDGGHDESPVQDLVGLECRTMRRFFNEIARMR